MKINKFLFRLIIAAPLLFCKPSYAQFDFQIAPEGYLNGRGVSVLCYHNDYYVGKQGGIEIIQYDKRIMTNGMVRYKLNKTESREDAPEYFSEPIPETIPVSPETDPANRLIRVKVIEDAINMEYELKIQGLDSLFIVSVDFKGFSEMDMVEEISFEIELFPGFYRGKSYIFEDKQGIFPLNFYHPVSNEEGSFRLEPMGTGKKLTLAPETPRFRIDITAKNGEMQLLDTRRATNHNWYTLKVVIDKEKMKDEKFSLIFRPHHIKDYIKKPLIAYSQIGYHPGQKKEVVIEADTNYVNSGDMTLYFFDTNTGSFRPIQVEKPEFWGKYNRYNIFTFDFSSIKQEGLYYLSLSEDIKTKPFRISSNVYNQGVWQPTLETFLPVQMCHMRIQDRNRIWHGRCHMDDAMQAPAPLGFFDGFSQGDTTDTPFQPYMNIPGLNTGGWHDAGDDDVNSNSTGRTVYHLALIKEEFGVDTDQTTVDFQKGEVLLHRPDGESDLIQQMKQGLNFLLASYEAVGHGIVGMISSDFETYCIPGSWENMTDQLIYDPAMDENYYNATHSGKCDDRFAFTNKDTRAEYRNAWVFAAASRALESSDDSLATVCLKLAEEIWSNEMNSEPVYYESVGVPGNLLVEQICAAAELFITTEKIEYITFIEDNLSGAYTNMESTCWTIARLADKFSNKDKKKEFENKLITYRDSLISAFEKNPYGTYLDATLWGYGWDILWRTYKYYYLTKHYPELFPFDPILNCNEFLLGKHPYSHASYVSGVGSEIPLPAFGLNRSDYSYIPGGVFSGVNMIEPDFPELLEDHPFIWQQSEYIIHGATPYIFTILAADKYLNPR